MDQLKGKTGVSFHPPGLELLMWELSGGRKRSMAVKRLGEHQENVLAYNVRAMSRQMKVHHDSAPNP